MRSDDAAPTRMTRSKLSEYLAERATDPVFRRALIEDPRRVLAREFGIQVPPNIQVRVIEEDADTYHLVLPYTPRAGAELDDAELERVAGGKVGPSIDL